MRTIGQITNVAESINKDVREAISSFINSDGYKAKVESMKTMSAQDAANVATSIVESIGTCCVAPVYDGLALPKYIAGVKVVDDNPTSISFSIRSKLKVTPKYSKTVDIAIGDNFLVDLSEVLVDSLFEMFYQEVAKDNVAELNEKLDAIVEANNIPYTFRFAISDVKGMLVSIDDTGVVFNASVNEALGIASFGLMLSGDNYSDMVAKEAEEKVIDVLKTCQTPVQLVKSNFKLIKELTGISTKKHASKIIRGVYHRNAMYLSGVKTGVAYYNEVVKINGEDTEVFALVEKTEDGDIKCILAPFDESTLFNVDYDVVAAVKAM